MNKEIESFMFKYIVDNRPLEEMGYYLKKEFAGLTYNEAVMILDKVLENMQKVNVAFLK